MPAVKAGLATFKNPFILALISIFVLGMTLPVPREIEGVLALCAQIGVGALFFLYGARIPRAHLLAGIRNYRLQIAIGVSTFILFPLVGLLIYRLAASTLPPALALGMLFVSLLPSTVQSSVTFTSIAGGNVGGAICAASFSNLAGTVLTPLWVWAVMGQDLILTWGQAGKLLVNILLPFFVGHFFEPRAGNWLRTHRRLTRITDNSTVLLVVAHAVVLSRTRGLWENVSAQALGIILLESALLLVAMLALTWLAGKLGKLGPADRIALVMCGSKKSLTTGLPIAAILFPPTLTAAVTIPVLVFHQLQLFVCSCLAEFLHSRQTS